MLERVKYIVNIVIVALMLATVTIVRDGRVGGYDVLKPLSLDNDEEVAIESTLADGTRVINSAPLAKDVVGFGGRTPVKIYVKGDVIEKVVPEPNSETPSFFDEVVKSGLFERWHGLSLADAATENVDIVSGATYSSWAIAENVKRAAEWGAQVDSSAAKGGLLAGIEFKDVIALLVILLGVAITLTKSRNKMVMTIQLVLNVVVLGFWCGSFLSLSTLTTWVGNGVNLSLGLVSFALLCVVIVMPLLGHKATYCQLHCPMGSAQELLNRVPNTKLKLHPKVAKVLSKVRYMILMALLFMMWMGVGFDLMNYEIFSAFIISSASTVVLVMAVVFLILSLFIHRPYCRFVCPTGALITIAQKTKGEV